MRKITGTLLVAAMLVLGCGRATAQPARHSVDDSLMMVAASQCAAYHLGQYNVRNPAHQVFIPSEGELAMIARKQRQQLTKQYGAGSLPEIQLMLTVCGATQLDVLRSQGLIP